MMLPPIEVFLLLLTSRRSCAPAADASAGSITRRVLQLLEPVEAHGLQDPAVDDDDPCFVGRIGIEVLMGAVGGNIDEIALAPLVALRLGVPRPLEFVLAVEADVPMQIVAAPLDDLADLFGEM